MRWNKNPVHSVYYTKVNYSNKWSPPNIRDKQFNWEPEIFETMLHMVQKGNITGKEERSVKQNTYKNKHDHWNNFKQYFKNPAYKPLSLWKQQKVYAFMKHVNLLSLELMASFWLIMDVKEQHATWRQAGLLLNQRRARRQHKNKKGKSTRLFYSRKITVTYMQMFLNEKEG